MREKRDIEKNIKYLLKQIKGTLNNIDWYLVTKSLQSNVVRHEKQNLKTHEKVGELNKEFTISFHFIGKY